ncbi:MAG: ABC transporter permease [Candidatus Promineifilaceae bacterium]|nr:ABC transporter permease [Candidatus Promineifilaceae bacterium]
MSTRTDSELLAAETPITVIEPSGGWLALQLNRIWQYRELLYFLVWRDIKVRYKQTLLGVLWIVLQPLISMAVFTVLFGYLMQVPSGDVPYPVFVYAGLLPWNYFASALTRASTGLVNNAHLITKVYFPRLIIPLASVTSSLLDFAISLGVYMVLMVAFGVSPAPTSVYLPGFLLLAVVTALGFGLWLGAFNVRYRDVNYVVPYLIQLWLYLTPVIYPVTFIPEQFRWILALNPMTGVVEGFRWAVLGPQLSDAQPPSELFLVSLIIAVLVLVSGAIYFRRTERTFADII